MYNREHIEALELFNEKAREILYFNSFFFRFIFLFFPFHQCIVECEEFPDLDNNGHRNDTPASKKYIKAAIPRVLVTMDEAYEKFKGIITVKEFENLIKEKIENVGGLLTREGAIAIIAAEHGIDLGIKEKNEAKK